MSGWPLETTCDKRLVVSGSDALEEVFPPSIIEALRSVPNPTEALRVRLHVLMGDLPHMPDVELLREAWEKYVRCATRLSFFDGAQGEDLRSRLVGKDDDLFRSAMSECFAAWFLSERLHLKVSPRPMGRSASVLEMAVASKDGDINVEVKAPRKPLPTTGVWVGDDADALRSAIKSANEQFEQGRKNLLVIVPQLPTFFWAEPRGLRRFMALKAFVVEETIRVAIDPTTGGPAGPIHQGWRPSGEFVKSRPGKKRWFTRTGAALLINEHIAVAPLKMTCSAMLVHNPSARNPLPTDLWRGVDQFCEVGGGQWTWRDAERRDEQRHDGA